MAAMPKVKIILGHIPGQGAPYPKQYCSNTNANNAALHSWLTDPSYHRKWHAFVKSKDWKMATTSSRICSAHFNSG